MNRERRVEGEPTNADIVAELRRVTVLFQARALAAVMGFPAPTSLPAQNEGVGS